MHIRFIINAFKGQVHRLAAHPYGCRVIQRMLEHCDEPDRQSILAELHACTASLIPDQFGNYVIQHVIENGEEKDRARIISIVISQLLVFSKHKFASNVVEKSIEFGEPGQRSDILRLLTTPNERGENPLLGLMRDQYGNYVIRKCLDLLATAHRFQYLLIGSIEKVLGQLKGAERDTLVEQIEPQLSQLKKFSYGKQIVAIEKLIFDSHSTANSQMESASSFHKSSSQSSRRSSSFIDANTSGDDGGVLPPSPLADTQSSRGSSLPSTNTSVVECLMETQKPNSTSSITALISDANADVNAASVTSSTSLDYSNPKFRP
jgi:mRNA-binding protein PUF3